MAAAGKLGARFDALVCNAGIMALPQRETAHGQELQFFTNHIGYFILVTGLLDRLADDGRVVVLSSDAHRRAPRGGIDFADLTLAKSYSPWAAYGQSKFANILFAKELAKKLAGTRQTANALHPGVIATNLARHMNPLVSLAFAVGGPLALKAVPQGAATETYVAVNLGAVGITGAYWQDCNVGKPRPDPEDPAAAARLWEVSEKIVAAQARDERGAPTTHRRAEVCRAGARRRRMDRRARPDLGVHVGADSDRGEARRRVRAARPQAGVHPAWCGMLLVPGHVLQRARGLRLPGRRTRGLSGRGVRALQARWHCVWGRRGVLRSPVRRRDVPAAARRRTLRQLWANRTRSRSARRERLRHRVRARHLHLRRRERVLRHERRLLRADLRRSPLPLRRAGCAVRDGGRVLQQPMHRRPLRMLA